MQLTKHHGLGNDFLVLLDDNDEAPLTAAMARRWCHRTEGIGADGFIRGTRSNAPDAGQPALRFELRNADGSEAEISGNGMRCFAQAALMAGWIAAESQVVTVGTAAGQRTVEVRQPGHPTLSVAVGMGPVSSIPVDVGALRHATVPKLAAALSVGNPHLVMLVDDLGAVDPAAEGPPYQSQFPAGVNVEWIVQANPDQLDFVVYERGAGVTLACGSGAVAAAVAAQRWGLVDGCVAVNMPGGVAHVELGGAEPVLIGPSTFVACVVVETLQ